MEASAATPNGGESTSTMSFVRSSSSTMPRARWVSSSPAGLGGIGPAGMSDTPGIPVEWITCWSGVSSTR